MVQASDISGLRRAAADYGEAERLKARFVELQRDRQPFYLTGDDLQPVFFWKLGAQYGRVRAKLEENTELAYRVVTRAAFEIRVTEKPAYEAEVRLRLLSALSGVGAGIASAVLALVEPERYCVIDFRGWRAVFGMAKNVFGAADYNRYLQVVQGLARELGWPVQEVDLAIWEYDRRKGQGAV